MVMECLCLTSWPIRLLEMQPWITPEAEPLLWAIRDHAVDVDIDHTRRADWEKLLELIDQLPKNGAAK